MDTDNRERTQPANRREKRPPPAERLAYRPDEAAAVIGISRSKMYELIRRGEIPSKAVGGVHRIPVDALRAWLRP